MRVIFAPLLAVATIAAANTGDALPDAPSADTTAPALAAPLPDARVVVMGRGEADSAKEQVCRDRISQARQDAGKPPLLDREPASPDKPYHIYAVDRRQDGCAVMVMKGDPADIRPLPVAPDGPLLLIPAGSGR
ncbi:MAG: hypothetical protein KJ872_08860 [Alphaproteobacteria bacterium]|nr:hypothetical protein [Alphaproteobacteria bacterium]